MFCSNCGKNLPDDAKYCDACGTIARSDEKEQSSYSKDGVTYQGNNENTENTESPFTNAAYHLGVTQAQNGYIEQPIPYQPYNHKKLWGREITIPIAAISLAVVLIFIGFSVYSTLKDQKYGSQDNRIHQQYGVHNYGDIPDSDDYDEYGDFFNQYGDFFGNYGGGYNYGNGNNSGNDSGGGYKGYGNNNGSGSNGGYGNGSSGTPGNNGGYGNGGNGTPGNSGGYGNGNNGGSGGQVSDPLPTDRNGNSASSKDYEWPTGDGTYEFYAKSTIPKFESVTGKTMTASETDNSGNTYYKYEMDMDAYNKYLDVLKNAGYSQTKFDAQGRDSYVMYENGNQYLIIYLMNSENQIVIMA